MDGRATKRARQACHTCRRKKTRCPGERPICSFCERLGQNCSYAEEPNNDTRTIRPRSHLRTAESQEEQVQSAQYIVPLEKRFASLEGKIDVIFGHILTGSSAQQPSSPMQDHLIFHENMAHQFQQTASIEMEPTITQPQTPNGFTKSTEAPLAQLSTAKMLHQSSSQDLCESRSYEQSWQNLPCEVRSHIVQLYIEHCDCQPLPLLNTGRLAQNFGSYSKAVQYLVMATALRFSQEPFPQYQPQSLALELRSGGRRMIFDDIANGNIRILTLQALCLHVFLDLSSGNFPRAKLDIGIGLCLSEALQISTESDSIQILQLEDRRRCYWSLNFLKSLAISNPQYVYTGCKQQPPFPQSTILNLKYSTTVLVSGSHSGSSSQTEDLGIIGYSIQLMDLWRTSVDYVTGLDQNSEAAWDPNSSHFQIVERIMEWESFLCKHHRYTHVSFAEQQSATISENRPYWGPWFLVQFTYHGTLCLVNHPFIHSEKATSASEVTCSIENFLEKSSDLALLHAKHITRLIDTLEQKSIHVSDPFFAHSAAIAATTHLWFCYVEDRGVRVQAQGRLMKCYQFILRLAKLWPIAGVLAENLAKIYLHASKWKVIYEPSFHHFEFPVQDKKLLWSLMSYGSAINTAEAFSNIDHSSLDPCQSFQPVQSIAPKDSENVAREAGAMNAEAASLYDNPLSRSPLASTSTSHVSVPNNPSPPLLHEQSLDMLFTSLAGENIGLGDFTEYGIESQVGLGNYGDDWFDSSN